MRHVALTLMIALAALPALAQTVPAPPTDQSTQPALNAEGFDAYTLGRTLSYNSDGTAFGIEEYLPNRRVRWAFVGQQCQEGVWYERNGFICFLYDDAPTNEQCWSFFASDGGLRGIFQGADGPGRELYEVQQSDQPLTCTGPGVGV